MYEFQYNTVDRRNVARPRKRWTKTVKSKQVQSSLYLAAATADNDTAFSYITDRSEASTVLSRCDFTSVHTTNTEPCSDVSTI